MIAAILPKLELPEAFVHWMRDAGERFDAAAAEMLPAADEPPERLHRAMRYAVLGGGKRVRPLLVYAAGELSAAAVRRRSTRAALAVEYVHAYSLVHDDLPCMDDDVLRRGKPTVHVEFDEATAMLAGDALQAEAFKVSPTARCRRAADIFADARTGARCWHARHVRRPGASTWRRLAAR